MWMIRNDETKDIWEISDPSKDESGINDVGLGYWIPIPPPETQPVINPPLEQGHWHKTPNPPEIENRLVSAIRLALYVFKDKIDKGGKPMVFHSLRVMMDPSLTTENERIVGVLHDTIEDSEEVGYDEICTAFGSWVANAVQMLTKPASVNYFDYVMALQRGG